MRMRWTGKYYVVRARFYTKEEIKKLSASFQLVEVWRTKSDYMANVLAKAFLKIRVPCEVVMYDENEEVDDCGLFTCSEMTTEATTPESPATLSTDTGRIEPEA